jgi:DNA-binding CsgD family transcriptional regulator
MNNDLLNSAASVRTVDEFKQWTRDYLRKVLPHEALLCVLGHLHAAGVALEYLVLVDYPVEHLEAIRNRAGAIDSPIVHRWLIERRPLLFDAEEPWPDSSPEWLASFRRHDLRNLAVHAVADTDLCLGTYHGFYRIPGKLGPQHEDLLRALAPVMHQVLCRVINYYGRESCNDLSLTPREREILHWVGVGKTNSEIAILVGIAVDTVKHHVSRLLAKFGVANRAQLVRVLIERERRNPPGYRTQLL